MSIVDLINPAGGIYYHAKAFRYRRLWQPFMAEIDSFLMHWPTQFRKLVIVGSSGGYTISKRFLDQFPEITIIDPDPLVLMILRRRFSHQFKYSAHNYLDSCDGPAQLITDFPHHNFLFANILGQRPLLFSETNAEIKSWFLHLQTALTGSCWSSFHDRISTKQRPLLQLYRAQHRLNNQEIIDLFFNNQPGNYFDHCVEMNDDYDFYLYIAWMLSPKQYHIVECLNETHSK